jgi:tetratricopeptide (TPR) repeat protein
MRLDVVEKYIANLQESVKSKDAELKKLKGEEPKEPMQKDDAAMKQDDEDANGDEPAFPPLYDASGGEDFDKAGDCKQEAADLQAAGDWEAALGKYNEAVLAAPPSALLYANRANALLKLGRPRAAERDCDLALQDNPDSAKVKSRQLQHRQTCLLAHQKTLTLFFALIVPVVCFSNI